MSTGPWRPAPGDRDPRRAVRPGRWSLSSTEGQTLESPADRARLEERARLLEWGAILLVGLLILGFWHLQGVHGTYYAERAEANQMRQFRVRPPRGLILDRNGEILAANHASYEVAIVRESVGDVDETLAWLAEVLEQPVDVLAERLDRGREWPRFRPVVVATEVQQSRVVSIEARRREHPGVIVRVAGQRHYPRGRTAAHVLGHVGEINRSQLEAWGGEYRIGDIVGQSGIEGVYNGDLAGAPGWRLSVVNSLGREIRPVEQQPPRPGRNVMLTLDVGLQERAEALLEGRRGAIVAIDVATGGVLTLASAPAFDPNAFAVRFSAAEWREILEDPAKPLQNRALRAMFPPGSIFKLVMAAAGLEEGIIHRDTRIFCAGGKRLYGRFFGCLGHHGSIDVIEALALSCNTFFYQLGVDLGRERIVRWARSLGLGQATGVDLTEEQGGILPSDAWLESRGLRFYPGETVSISIGQGRLGISPLQAAHMAATVATGFRREPHLLMAVEESSAGRAGSRTYPIATRSAEFHDGTRQVLLEGMRRSAAYGTSRRAGLEEVEIGGKTGTAQVASASNIEGPEEERRESLRNHAWFVGVAPVDEPQIVVAVFVEHGGSGGRAAAPLGGALLAHHFGVPLADVRYTELPPQPEGEAAAPGTGVRDGAGGTR